MKSTSLATYLETGPNSNSKHLHKKILRKLNKNHSRPLKEIRNDKEKSNLNDKQGKQMPINVFVSVTTPFNKAQEHFLVKIENLLRDNGMRPNTIGRNVFSHDQPLQIIDQAMRNCAGILVLGLRRKYIELGVDKPASTNETSLDGTNLATPWNQIEAALGHTLRLPLFVVPEQGVKDEGLLERGYDWMVATTDPTIDPTTNPELMAHLES